MPRPKRLRKVINPPQFKGFKPYGYYGKEEEPVLLLLEEYESIRLLDYKGLSQVEAAEQMEVSRPTLTRIYQSARKKVASAFALAKPILVEGGKVYFDEEWYYCQNCHSRFNSPEKSQPIIHCPICGSEHIQHVEDTFQLNR